MERASQCLHSEVRDGQKTEREKENRVKGIRENCFVLTEFKRHCSVT